jgi:TolB-like protein
LCPEAVADLPAAKMSPAASISQPIVAPRLSIVVLPFTNLTDDREQQYFAEGITEDLTTDLSRIAGMFVISRNIAFTYRNKPIDTKQIGRELDVRYALEGSVRRSGSQVRVSAQLIDAETDAHLWAERLDRDIGDLFALQDEITSRIANALNIELIAAEAARPSEHADAFDYILRGRAARLSAGVCVLLGIGFGFGSHYFVDRTGGRAAAHWTPLYLLLGFGVFLWTTSPSGRSAGPRRWCGMGRMRARRSLRCWGCRLSRLG